MINVALTFGAMRNARVKVLGGGAAA